ncbi:MAG: histidinol-phosphatase HisJ family protein [Ruminococcaceae bacterium]|nr:histidinol-phosphatase HisJ family protein [Oscillospiraceae bacterium]
MRYANQHMHSAFASFDAEGSLGEMIAASAEAGLSLICFTDHMDMADEKTGRARSALPERRDSFLRRRAAAESLLPPGLTVRFGMELGGPMQLPHEAVEATDLPGLDFVIASVHNIPNVPDFYFHPFGCEEECEALNRRYLLELLRLADFPDFDVMGHIGYTTRYMRQLGFAECITVDKYGDELRAILARLIENGRGLECNTSGYRDAGAPYPGEDILRLYRSLGGEIITVGSDAHSPSQVAFGIREGYELLKNCGFRYVSEFRERQCEFIPLT